MGQQISIEDAFPTFQKRCRELFEENLLLRAQVDVLERKVGELEAHPPYQAGDERLAPPAEEAPYGDHANLDQQNDVERVHG